VLFYASLPWHFSPFNIALDQLIVAVAKFALLPNLPHPYFWHQIYFNCFLRSQSVLPWELGFVVELIEVGGCDYSSCITKVLVG